MSATGITGVRDPDDYYETPAWAVEALLDRLVIPPTARILEPGCGTGAILKVLRNRYPEAYLEGVELHPGRAERSRPFADVIHAVDFLRENPHLGHGDRRFDFSIGNPPFSLAAEFIARSLAIADVVCLLLRVNYLGSDKRAAFHREHPAHLDILPKRPSFAKSVRCAEKCGWETLTRTDDPHPTRCSSCGAKVKVITTDSCEYAWFCWGLGPGFGGTWRILEVNDSAA